ncbi:MAG TPA: sensor histidine kinase [Candidatus Atribacteria bacterium]|nr:sensor histidine kinase [Candidatus Atribacteria bacterium]HCU22744.1 sensor histidine kinase [Candidatus Atribacteria bacterium]
MIMKNLPLAIQIWLIFALLIIVVTVALLLIIPFSLDRFFTNEIYANIENGQDIFQSGEIWQFPRNVPPIVNDEADQNIRTVRHLLFNNDKQIFPPNPLPRSVLENFIKQAQSQEMDLQRYQEVIRGNRMFYVIRRISSPTGNFYLLSYMWDSYRQSLVRTLFRQLSLVMGMVFILSWIPAIILAQYLTKPLVILEKHVSQIAKQNWEEPVVIQREDEIGRLAKSIDVLRNRLMRQNEIQQNSLQNISHALKTPVMVIRSYAQSILDGIFPKGNLEASVLVIDQEAERLEKRNRDLLYLTKLDVLNTINQSQDQYRLDELIIDVMNRFQIRRKDIKWITDLEDISYSGDYEQWTVALENLLDNQVRYAHNTISISLKAQLNSQILIQIGNDGPPIEEKTMKTLFEKFHPGMKGEFGLGLSITARIIKLHGGTISVANQEKGVTFSILIPAQKS